MRSKLRRKRIKMIWSLKQLVEHSSRTHALINGKWVPCRPITWKYLPIIERIKDALAVFNGKAEAFTWPEGQ